MANRAVLKDKAPSHEGPASKKASLKLVSNAAVSSEGVVNEIFEAEAVATSRNEVWDVLDFMQYGERRERYLPIGWRKQRV